MDASGNYVLVVYPDGSSEVEHVIGDLPKEGQEFPRSAVVRPWVVHRVELPNEPSVDGKQIARDVYVAPVSFDDWDLTA